MQGASLAMMGCAVAVNLPPAARATTDDVPQARGAAVFSAYCVLCHGPLGKGDGRAAALQPVPPADLTQSRRSGAYKLQIIREGGAALNRSSSMPAWREVLTAEQIADVAVYVSTLQSSPSASAAISSARHSARTAATTVESRGAKP
jgi:mono/diheme cytochrome c family protein